MNCSRAAAEVTAERAVLAYLDGSCHTPIAASAIYGDDGMLRLDAMILRPDGEAAHRRHIVGSVMMPPALVRSLAWPCSLMLEAGNFWSDCWTSRVGLADAHHFDMMAKWHR